MSRPSIAAITASAAFLASAVTDVFCHVPAGILIAAGFIAYVAFQWWLFTDQVQRAVARAVSAWMAGTEMEAALAGWPAPQSAADDQAGLAEVRTLIPVLSHRPPAKHRRAGQ